MDTESDDARERLSVALDAADRSSSSNQHYREFESLVAELVGIDPRRVCASTISQASNFTVRAEQSKKAQEADLFVGVVTRNDHLDATKRSAARSVKRGRSAATVLMIRDADGWRPVWGVEGVGDESSPLTRFARLMHIEVDRVEVDQPRASDLRQAYSRDPNRFRALIERDPSASDVVAIAHRRRVVGRFRTMLEDESYFKELRKERRGEEAVWQSFLEENPWILGIGLSGQLFVSWNKVRLEQVVAGFSVAGPGKRTDALLRTAGNIRSLVFAEIKHHNTPLLGGSQYRPGCWGPSIDLAGGVAQVQQTLELASREVREVLPEVDDEGADTGDVTFFIRPRSFLIIGHLKQLRGSGEGVHRARLRSFELYRRNLYEPEILTFDELLARAEWHVTLAEAEGSR